MPQTKASQFEDENIWGTRYLLLASYRYLWFTILISAWSWWWHSISRWNRRRAKPWLYWWHSISRCNRSRAKPWFWYNDVNYFS